MFVACGIWCLADVSSVSPSSEQTAYCLQPDYIVAKIYNRMILNRIRSAIDIWLRVNQMVSVQNNYSGSNTNTQKNNRKT